MTAPGQADATLHIGDVAERVGLSLRTVRYYEEQGLIEPAGRTAGGFRLYTDAQVERLLLIKQMKPLGYTVPQMCDLLVAQDRLTDADPERRRAAEAQVAAFAADAAERCDGLREQLRKAEEFARRLEAGPGAGGRPTG